MKNFLRPTKGKIILAVFLGLVSYFAADYWSSNSCFMNPDKAYCPYVTPFAAWVLMVFWTIGLSPALIPFLRDNSPEMFLRLWFGFAYIVSYLSIYVIVCGLDWVWRVVKKKVQG